MYNCKEKENNYAKEYIKKIQNVYKQEDIVIKMPQIINKGKQRVEEEVFLYKPYNVSKSRPKTSELQFIQDEINNLEKYIKYIQSPIKMMPFYPPSYYKFLWLQEEQDKQYWNKIAVEFLKKKYNVDITRKELPIKIYSGGPPHKLYFITFTLQGQIIISPMKKMVALYVVGDLVLLD